jgi:hypothetical protein
MAGTSRGGLIPSRSEGFCHCQFMGSAPLCLRGEKSALSEEQRGSAGIRSGHLREALGMSGRAH